MKSPGSTCGLIVFFVCLIFLCIQSTPHRFDEFLLCCVVCIPGLLVGALIGNAIFKKKDDTPQSEDQPQSAPKSSVEKLGELKKLLDSGALTQEEFDAMKKKIINEL